MKMGVSKSHIDFLKREVCVKSDEYQLFYKYADKTEDLKLVPGRKSGASQEVTRRRGFVVGPLHWKSREDHFWSD